jgi:hypothetical protein
MEDITVIKVSELTAMEKLVLILLDEIRELRRIEEEAKAYTIQHTADLLEVHHCTVRKFIKEKKLFAKYIDGRSGKCMVPLWSIKAYLKSKENSNH